MCGAGEASRSKDRIAGWVLLACGAVCSYVGVGEPLRAAERAEEVRLHLHACLLVPFALVYGTAYAFFADAARRILGSRTQPTRLGWIVIVVLVTAGLGLYVFIRLDLEGRGYRF